jgi:hypothetical protein
MSREHLAVRKEFEGREALDAVFLADSALNCGVDLRSTLGERIGRVAQWMGRVGALTSFRPSTVLRVLAAFSYSGSRFLQCPHHLREESSSSLVRSH